MGRLYWKFFLFFFFAQLSTVLIVSVTIGVMRENERENRILLASSSALSQEKLRTPPLAKPPPPFNQQFNPAPRHRPLLPLIPVSVGVFVSLIFAAILAWYFSRPIKQLRLAFESAASGNLDARVGAAMQGRRDELADLGSAFDVMASRVGSLIASKTRLMHQVSHELRSPLARLQIAIGLIKQTPASAENQPEKLSTALNRIEREAVRMDSLVGELLTLSRLESGMLNMQKNSMDLNELLEELLADANFEGKSRSVTVQYAASSPAPILLLAEYDLLHRAIDNVVRNAIKYSADGQVVVLNTNMDTRSSSVTLSVRDFGIGLNQADIEQIFQPFYRANNQVSTNDGHGLGLSIAQQIVEAHGGKISAHTTGQGLLVNIVLPLATAVSVI